MSRFKLLAAATAGLALLAPLVPSAAQADAFKTTVTVQAVSGTGCPSGSVSLVYPSVDSFTLLYRDFQVWGGGFKNCQVVAKVNVPSGWSYTVAQETNRGWAQLDGKGSATIQTYSYFSDSVYSDRRNTTLPANYNDSWQTTVYPSVQQWSSCNRTHTLNISDVISVKGPSASNSVALFSKDVSASTTFLLKFRAC